jgi:uncharacterized protein (UPF0332 family)
MISEARQLLVKAERSLQAAQGLNTDNYPEFATSRAYYTMFYIAEAFLISKGLSYSSHAAVIAAFGQQFAKTQIVPQKYHRYLLDAQDQRNRGDYDIDPHLTKDDANKLIQQATEMLEFATQIFSENN